MTIRNLLYLGFGLLILLFLTSGLITWWQLRSIASNLTSIEEARQYVAEVRLPMQAASLEMEINARELVSAALMYVRKPNPQSRQRAASAMQDFEDYYGGSQKKVVKGFANPAQTDEEKLAGSRVYSGYETLKSLANQLMDSADRRKQLRQSLRDAMASLDKLIDQLRAAANQANAAAAGPRAEAAWRMELAVEEAQSAYEGYLVEADDSLKQAAKSAQEVFDGALAAYRAAGPGPEDGRVLQQLEEEFPAAAQTGSSLFQITDDLNTSIEQFAEASTAIDTLLDGEVQPLVTGEALTARQATTAAVDSMTDSISLATAVIFSVLLVGLILGGAVAIAIANRVTRPLSSMVQLAESVAEGDLTYPALAEGTSETGRLAAAFNKMAASLRGILAEAKAMTSEVAAASSEITTSAQQQLSTLNQTATSLNQITTTAEQFKTTMQEFADRARAVQEAANETAARSTDGRSLTKESAASIEQVRANSESAGGSVLGLSEQMQRIGEITATVNEIAEQTKLLALNASIEAARAGDDGRGFAVVATQVRELANQSKEAAGRIESLIGDTQKLMQNVVDRIEEGGRLSESSTETVGRVTSAFEDIAQAIEHTREAMSQINLGAKQQEQGVAELVASIAQIDTASKESLAAAEQTQKSIVAIDTRIRSLNQSIATFKT